MAGNSKGESGFWFVEKASHRAARLRRSVKYSAYLLVRSITGKGAGCPLSLLAGDDPVDLGAMDAHVHAGKAEPLEGVERAKPGMDMPDLGF